MFNKLIVTDNVEVARIDSALSFRAWDEVECDFGVWRQVDSFVLGVIQTMPTASDDDVADVLSGNSVHNLSNETALAIVQAVRGKSMKVSFDSLALNARFTLNDGSHWTKVAHGAIRSDGWTRHDFPRAVLVTPI